jgi:hypothetical protein
MTCRRGPLPVVLCGLAAALLTTPTAEAQRVYGNVVDTAGAPLRGVAIELRVDANAVAVTAVSDSAGFFELTIEAPGAYQLVAGLDGYESVGPATILAAPGEDLEIQLRLAVATVALHPIEVRARRRLPTTQASIHRRIEQMRQQGTNRALTRDQLDRMRPQSVNRALVTLSSRVNVVDAPAITMNTVFLRDSSRRGQCAAAVFIDGFRVNARPTNVNMMIEPKHIEAIELYIGTALVPAGFHDPTGCGSVLIWSRQGPDQEGDSRPGSWRRWAIAGGLATGILFLLR